MMRGYRVCARRVRDCADVGAISVDSTLGRWLNGLVRENNSNQKQRAKENELKINISLGLSLSVWKQNKTKTRMGGGGIVRIGFHMQYANHVRKERYCLKNLDVSRTTRLLSGAKRPQTSFWAFCFRDPQALKPGWSQAEQRGRKCRMEGV